MQRRLTSNALSACSLNLIQSFMEAHSFCFVSFLVFKELFLQLFVDRELPDPLGIGGFCGSGSPSAMVKHYGRPTVAVVLNKLHFLKNCILRLLKTNRDTSLLYIRPCTDFVLVGLDGKRSSLIHLEISDLSPPKKILWYG